MKELKFKLLLQLSSIIKKMGVRDEMTQKMHEVRREGVDADAVGIEMIMILFENVSLAEQELYTFVEDLTGLENVAETNMMDVINAITEAFNGVDIQSFFSQLSSMKK